MLGFKEAVKRDINEAWGALEDMRVSMEKSLNLFIRLPGETILTNEKDGILSTNFSDSIIIFSSGDKREDLHRMLIMASQFFAYALNKCVPLRGAISFGEFYLNLEKNLFCGPPLIEAYEIGENAQWSGIVVSESFAAKYKENPLRSSDQEVVIKYPIPTKGDPQSGWVLNWPLVFKNNFDPKISITPENFALAFKRLFGDYNSWSPNVKKIYENTVEFINLMLSPK